MPFLSTAANITDACCRGWWTESGTRTHTGLHSLWSVLSCASLWCVVRPVSSCVVIYVKYLKMTDKKCTKCGNPVRGHNGPTGSSCNNMDIQETEAVGGESPGTNQLLQTLITQMTAMNVNIEKLATISADRHREDDEIDTNSNMDEEADDIDTDKPDEKPRDRRAYSGEFVTLSEFLPDMHIYTPSKEMEPFYEKGELRFRSKKPKRSIDSFTTWLSAWNRYELVVVAEHLHLHKKFVEYREIIQNCDKNFRWSAVHLYDTRLRLRRAETKSFDFDVVDTTLYATIFDTTAVKRAGKQCLRCKSYDHHVSDCPYPEEYQVAENNSQTARKKSRDTRDRWFHNGVEGCDNYQSERSCSYPGCKRAHVCRYCRGPDPYNRCSRCADTNST